MLEKVCAFCGYAFPVNELKEVNGEMYCKKCFAEIDDIETCAWCKCKCYRCEMKKDTALGWLCEHCINGIKSRGEQLTLE